MSNSPSFLQRLLVLVSHLPLGVLQTFARVVASLICLFPQQGMLRTVRRNLQLAYPTWSAQQLHQASRQAVVHQVLSLMEFLRVWGNPPADSLKRIRHVYDEHVLHEALACPQGCMAIVPHHGSWEVMNAWLNQFAAPVIMYKPDKDPDLNQFVLNARSRLTATLVPTDESGVRQIFRALKQGGFSIILPDHIPDASGGLMSPFFGVPVLTSTLAPKLAQKTQCALIQLACIRADDNPHLFDIFVERLASPDPKAPLQHAVDAMNMAIEQLIDRQPTHYHWSYKRFKASPHLGGYYHVQDEAQAEQMRLHYTPPTQ